MSYSESCLRKKLEMWWIDISSWWKAPHKSVRHLLDEINKEETSLMCSQDDVSRCVYVSTGDVYYRDLNNQLYLLKEEKQVFPEGEVKKRDLNSSISEKSSKNEDDKEGIIRALDKELWITNENIKSILDMWIEEKSRESQAYPGLLTKYILAKFLILLDWEIDIKKGFKE